MSGLLSKLAARQGSAWGTAVLPGSGHRKAFKSCDVQHRTERVQDNTLTGKATRAAPGAGGNLVVDGSINAQADYRQNELFIAAILGAAASPAAPGDTSDYTHVLPFVDNQTGKFLTIGHDAGAKRVEVISSFKLDRWLFDARTGNPAEDTFSGMGRGVDDSQASSSWTFATDPGGTGGRAIYLSQGVIRVNAETGDALDSDDVISPNRFAVEVRRNLTQDFAQAAQSEEPQPGDFADVEVTLEFFQMTAALVALFREAYQNKTQVKLDAVFTSLELAGATNVYYARKFYLPSLTVLECPLETPGPGPTPCRVRLSAHHASAVPSGFPTGYDEVLTVVLVNKLSAAILS